MNLKARVRCVFAKLQICPGLNANEIQIPYDKRHTEESSLVKNQQNKRNSVKYEVV